MITGGTGKTEKPSFPNVIIITKYQLQPHNQRQHEANYVFVSAS